MKESGSSQWLTSLCEPPVLDLLQLGLEAESCNVRRQIDCRPGCFMVE